jgi:hypothetical protein
MTMKKMLMAAGVAAMGVLMVSGAAVGHDEEPERAFRNARLCLENKVACEQYVIGYFNALQALQAQSDQTFGVCFDEERAFSRRYTLWIMASVLADPDIDAETHGEKILQAVQKYFPCE